MTPDTTRTTSRVPPLARLLRPTALVVLCGSLLVSATSASASVTLNGIDGNGMPINGMPRNGLPINGVPLNGIPLNGMPRNGMPLNGTPLQGLPMNGLPMQGTLNHCILEAPPRASATLPPPPAAGRLPWHRLSHTALGQR
jgi:hypothetical protein